MVVVGLSGHLHHMMFVEIFRITSTKNQNWIGMSIQARKTPETVSRTYICTRSGMFSPDLVQI